MTSTPSSFDLKNGDGEKFVFVFYLLPIDLNLKCIPLFVYPTLNGHAHQDILFIFDCLISILKQCDINIIYTVTDGDTFYNHINDEEFEKIAFETFEGGFYKAVEAWSNINTVKGINDMLHCLKLARKRLNINFITLILILKSKITKLIVHLLKKY